MNKLPDFLKRPAALISVGVAFALVIGVLGIWQYRKSVENEGQALQERLEQTHQMAQNSLSACLDQGQVAAQVADQEFTRLEDVLAGAVSARYVDSDGRALNGDAASGAAFSAIVEAYPDVDQASFQNLQAIVVGCRDEYQGAQDRLFNEATVLETWVQTDNIWNQEIKNNFPTDGLETIDYDTGEVLTGQAALDHMTRVILVGDARAAYASGELGEQDLFGDD